MLAENIPLLLLCIFLVAFLYSSVGHGGASGYLAIMALAGIEPSMMKPSALILNIFVASIAFYNYYRKGFFRWNYFWPFAIASIPAAMLGAQMHVDPLWYKRILAFCLVIAAMRIAGLFTASEDTPLRKIPIPAALIIGAIIGLLSGMIGIGGGILLSPILILMHWTYLKEASAVAAIFIVVNSISGLSVILPSVAADFQKIIPWVAVAVVGGIFGSLWGSRRATNFALRGVLAVVLVFASYKLVFA